jgi:glutamyl-Q tRNA(Asp) synthetase
VPAPYVGRFAPSPTGDLHLGSLLSAVGSFLDARAAGGRWLVRIEDLDTGRIVAGCEARVLATLQAFGLQWDGAIEHQSRRQAHYAHALAALERRGLTFPCSCSRRELVSEQGYPGTCRTGPKAQGPTAQRFRIGCGPFAFTDRLQGECRFELAALGDVIVRRRDGAFAYQLAVVVDDAAQGVTDVVRGSDLLDSTPWQMALQQALALPAPRYAHLPLVTEPDGAKLAKSRRSVALDPARAGVQLVQVLTLLGQTPEAKLELEPVTAILEWAVGHWDPRALAGVREVTAS